MGREEKDLTKRQKIDDLRLSDDEWERVGLFNDLLAVRHVLIFYTSLLTLSNSMPIMHSRHFHLIEQQHFTLHYPL
jgi:hypothetical protein